jgi:hypothetical protein
MLQLLDWEGNSWIQTEHISATHMFSSDSEPAQKQNSRQGASGPFFIGKKFGGLPRPASSRLKSQTQDLINLSPELFTVPGRGPRSPLIVLSPLYHCTTDLPNAAGFRATRCDRWPDFKLWRVFTSVPFSSARLVIVIQSVSCYLARIYFRAFSGLLL